jgi:hypothetical protein
VLAAILGKGTIGAAISAGGREYFVFGVCCCKELTAKMLALQASFSSVRRR